MSDSFPGQMPHPGWECIAQVAGEPLLLLDSCLRIRWLNQSAEQLFSAPAASLHGALLDALLDQTTESHRAGQAQLLQTLLHLEQGAPLKLQDLSLQRRDGALFVAEGTASRFVDPGVGESGILLQLRDVTRQYQEFTELQLSAKVFEHSGEAIMITDTLDRILAVNDAFVKMTGYDEDEILGSPPAFLRQGLREEVIYEEMWQSVHTVGHWKGEVHNRKKSGEVYPAWLALTAVRDKAGDILHYISIFSDITERKAREEHIRFLAEHDYLTGLPNRVLLQDRFEQAASLARRGDPHPMAVLFMDLDGFKAINDNAGHAVGDVLLQRVAAVLKESLRSTDSISRHGGDEFVILLSSLSDKRDAAAIAKKLNALLDAAFEIEGREYQISASLGISIYPEHGTSLDQLITCADQAMYAAKEQGKNTWALHAPACREST